MRNPSQRIGPSRRNSAFLRSPWLAVLVMCGACSLDGSDKQIDLSETSAAEQGDASRSPAEPASPGEPTPGTTPAAGAGAELSEPAGSEPETESDPEPGPAGTMGGQGGDSSQDSPEPEAEAGSSADGAPEPEGKSEPEASLEEEQGGASGAVEEGPVLGGLSGCSADFLFCEDFESGELGDDWEVRGAVPELDSARAARGQYSAHFHTEDNGLQYISHTGVFPVMENSFHVRMFVYFQELPTAPQWAHWTVSGMLGSGTDAEIRIGGQFDGSQNRLGVGTDWGPTGDWTYLDNDPEGSPEAVPAQQWVCLEWALDGPAQEQQFYWDDVEHPSMFVSSEDHGGSDDVFTFPDVESVWFGWWHYQSGTDPGEFDVWIDEIAIDDEPIGCSR